MELSRNTERTELGDCLREAHANACELVIWFHDGADESGLDLTPEQCDEFREGDTVNVTNLMINYSKIYPDSQILTLRQVFDVRGEKPVVVPQDKRHFCHGVQLSVM